MMADRSVVSVPIYVESTIAIGRSLKHRFSLLLGGRPFGLWAPLKIGRKVIPLLLLSSTHNFDLLNLLTCR